ncbi:hypothetical protein DLM_1144 [Aquitalea magnusonii]|uniref:Uncharacterized protein n=1 Tax=Aquitalea magnusonii TaxID=332411 RepID=A0A3G9GDM7_9NEIS|nr:hypothetical protein DLM_1144 [Aquitalea magnusonii]
MGKTHEDYLSDGQPQPAQDWTHPACPRGTYGVRRWQCRAGTA